MKKTLKKLLGIAEKKSSEKEPLKRRTIKKIPHEKSEAVVLEDLKASIVKNGCKSITIGGLFRAFGHQRRGPKNTEEIKNFLEKNNFHSYPSLQANLPWNSRIEIHRFPVKSKGELYEKERDLQKDLYKKGFLKSLNLDHIQPEISPDHTRDRMDFFAKDGDKNVVIEVKNKDGGKRAVEQVLRYAGMLKQQHPEIEVRKILITGVQDQHTAKAIHGMTEQEKNGFEWFLYIYDPTTGNIMFEKVEHSKFFSL